MDMTHKKFVVCSWIVCNVGLLPAMLLEQKLSGGHLWLALMLKNC